MKIILLTMGLLFFGLLPASVAWSKSGNDLPDVRAYGALPTISMVALSPSGERIAYRMHQDGKHFAVVYSLAENRHIASMDLAEITPKKMYFVGEDELVLVGSVVRWLMGYKGKHEWSTAYAFNVKRQEVRPLLTPGDGVYKSQSDLGTIVGMSSDKKYLYMPALVPDSVNDLSPRHSLMAVEVDSPDRPKVHFKGRNSSVDFILNKQGEVIAHVLFDDHRNLYRILARQEEDWKEIFRDETSIPRIAVVGTTPDMTSLVIKAVNSGSRRIDLYTLNLSGGELVQAEIGRGDADIEQIYMGLDRVVLGVRYSGFSPSYKFFDETLDQRLSAILTSFPEHSVWLADWSQDLQDLVVYVEGSQISGSYYKFTAGEPPQHVADTRPHFGPETINPIGKINLKARDGLIIPTLLTIPGDRVQSMKNLPAVMLPHGGPEAYDSLGFDWMAQALASRGYLVIQPQFRGSAGFGVDHRNAGHGEWGKKMQDDLTDSLAALVERGMVDPDRVCIAGASYGGYAALAGGALTPDLYRCVVSINGVTDLEEMMRDEEREYGSDHWVVAYWADIMSAGDTGKDRLREVSPAYHADSFQAPVLLIHGEDDMIVPFEQSRLMYKKLRRAKKTVQLVELEGETHNLVKSKTRQKTVEALVGFVDKHLQPVNAKAVVM
ncbi:prolyl oligopeptidase family serine peptidase [uncultured Microbulbifer sp.]|uniref:alpha/beta hydrolase family protein n=1 Tax=uncultured Microbulbifer sp. TaxID=348147 RepID=UPI002631B474|nr:prolyl oligopeptidase family serine peptidase [uncultured Microbulbifer sp.]